MKNKGGLEVSVSILDVHMPDRRREIVSVDPNAGPNKIGQQIIACIGDRVTRPVHMEIKEVLGGTESEPQYPVGLTFRYDPDAARASIG